MARRQRWECLKIFNNQPLQRMNFSAIYHGPNSAERWHSKDKVRKHKKHGSRVAAYAAREVVQNASPLWLCLLRCVFCLLFLRGLFNLLLAVLSTVLHAAAGMMGDVDHLLAVYLAFADHR